jgi:hypothetical protein
VDVLRGPITYPPRRDCVLTAGFEPQAQFLHTEHGGPQSSAITSSAYEAEARSPASASPPRNSNRRSGAPVPGRPVMGASGFEWP